MRTTIKRLKRFKHAKRGLSNVIVVMLSLVILVVISANVILWSYQMNQLDWEKMQEGISITDVEHINRSSWFVAQKEYTVNAGSYVSGSYTDTQAVDSQYERFMEASAISPYYPNGYGVSYGTYLSGTVPSSVQAVDSNYFIVRSASTSTSTTAYNPSGYNLLGTTSYVSGTLSDLQTDNGVYMNFRSYASSTTGQSIYTHQETTTISGTNYRTFKLASSDVSGGTTLTASMSSTGRTLFDKAVYPLQGILTIPASTWTFYYRAWKDTDPSEVAYAGKGTGAKGTGSGGTGETGSVTLSANDFCFISIAVGSTSVTVNGFTISSGHTATLIDGPRNSGSYVRSYIYYYYDSTGLGAVTPYVTLSGSARHAWTLAVYTGVNSANPYSGATYNTGSGTAPVTGSVTESSSGSMVVSGDVFGDGSTGSYTVSIAPAGSPAENERQEQDEAGAGSARGISSQIEDYPTSSSRTNRATGSSTGSSRTLYWVMQIVTLNKNPIPVGHCDVDVKILKSDNTVRSTITTNNAASSAITTSNSTLSGTYSWALYTVVAQTDYLEIDYYADTTTASSGKNAYLKIDDNTLATSAQTRIDNVNLPNQYTSEVEFTGSSNAGTWTQLVWNVDSAWTTGSVTVTIQAYNYTLGGYQTSGNGYDSYTSSTTANTDQTRNQTITTNPSHFRDASGNWKLKVKGVKTTTTQFGFNADWVEFKPTYYGGYRVSTEFTFSSMTTYTPTQLNFTVVSEYDIPSVSVTIQVWNYSSSTYVTSGEGYLTYTSSGSNETKLLSINTNPQFYTQNGSAKIKITGELITITQYQQRINQIKLDCKVGNKLDINDVYIIDLSTYPLAYIQTVEIQLRARGGEKWYVKAYNWSEAKYSNIGFNSTTGHTPTTGWDYYAVNLTTSWRSYVRNNGTIYIQFIDQGQNSTSTTIDIDFLGTRAVIDGARFTFQNDGALTFHLISLWVNTATNHRRYDINLLVNLGENTTYIRGDISLPTENFVVKAVTERGNIAVFARH